MGGNIISHFKMSVVPKGKVIITHLDPKDKVIITHLIFETCIYHFQDWLFYSLKNQIQWSIYGSKSPTIMFPLNCLDDKNRRLFPNARKVGFRKRVGQDFKNCYNISWHLTFAPQNSNIVEQRSSEKIDDLHFQQIHYIKHTEKDVIY